MLGYDVLLVIPEAALGRAAGDVVLDPVAGEDRDRPVVEGDREVHGPLALRQAEDRANPGVELEVVRGLVELGERGGQALAPQLAAGAWMVWSIEASEDVGASTRQRAVRGSKAGGHPRTGAWTTVNGT